MNRASFILRRGGEGGSQRGGLGNTSAGPLEPVEAHELFGDRLAKHTRIVGEVEQRLRVIAELETVVLEPFLGESRQFASAIADQRNLLTHPDSTSEGRLPTIDWAELWLKGQQLSLLLEVCLLYELGFTVDTISTLLPRNRRIRTIQLNRK